MTQLERELASAYKSGHDNYNAVMRGEMLWCPYDEELAPEHFWAWTEGFHNASIGTQ